MCRFFRDRCRSCNDRSRYLAIGIKQQGNDLIDIPLRAPLLLVSLRQIDVRPEDVILSQNGSFAEIDERIFKRHLHNV